MPITFTRIREQAQARGGVTDDGIREKAYVLSRHSANACSANEQAGQRDTRNAASDAWAALQGARRPAAG